MSLVRQRRIFLERLAPLQALPVAVLEPAVRTMCKSRSRFSCEPPQFCRFRQETRTRITGPGFDVERLPLGVPFSLDAVKSGDFPHACAGYISYPPRKLRVSLFNFLVFDNCYCSWSEAWVNVLAIPDRNTLTITQTSNLVRSLHQGKRQATACWLSTQRQSWILRYSAHDSGSQSFISEKIHALLR